MMNYDYEYEEDSNREYISKERFKKTLSIKPTKKLFSLKSSNSNEKKEEQQQVEIKPEVENIKLTWIKIDYSKEEKKTPFYDSDYPSLTEDKNEIKEKQIIISDEKEKGWTKIEKKTTCNNEQQNSKNIPEEINYALSMLSSEKFIIFEGTKHYGLLLNNSKSQKSTNNTNNTNNKNNNNEKKNQEKTQMCRMHKERKCRNGNNCRFAHSLSELVVNPCNFGEKCKCINLKKDLYTNFGDKICVYRHPGETRNDYYKRNNL